MSTRRRAANTCASAATRQRRGESWKICAPPFGSIGRPVCAPSLASAPTWAYLAKVAERSRPDYERTMSLVTELVTKKGDRVGDRRIRAITPLSADRIYQLVLEGKTHAPFLPPSDEGKTATHKLMISKD
jgi:hypothetical protein